VANGNVPDTFRSSSGHQRPSRRRGQWLGLTALATGMAVATVAVPPLVTPHRGTAPVASASPSVSIARPPASGAGSPSVGASSPSSGAHSPARFTPITVEAEDPHSTLSGGAAVTTCATCRGGHRVRYLCFTCRLVVHATVPVSGRRTVTVVYEADGDRVIKVRINDAPARTLPVTGPDWTTPRSVQFTADLPAGPLRLSLYNDETPAPDLDQVVIS
jgi:hypothetical protein